jgi:hypothetical protein
LSSFSQPQQLGESPRPSRRISSTYTNGGEERLGISLAHGHETPPTWDQLASRREVLLSNDESNAVQNLSVNFGLPPEPTKRVCVGLDLESVQRAIYDCHIHDGITATEP